MPSYKNVFPDRWLKPAVLQGARVRVKIQAVTIQELFNSQTNKKEPKLVARFVGKDLPMIFNKTNAQAMESITGTDDYAQWRGAEIYLSVGRAPNGKDTIVIERASASQPEPSPAAVSVPQHGNDDDIDLYPAGGAPGDVLRRGNDATADGARPVASADIFDSDDSGARPEATPEKVGARPINDGDSACTACHAPPGKPHASSCTASGKKDSGARPADTPVHSQAPAQDVARPGKQPEFDNTLFARLAGIYTSDIPMSKAASEAVRKCRNADSDSAMKMSQKHMVAITDLLKETVATDDNDCDMLLTALLGYQVRANRLPGLLVHGYLIKPLREQNPEFILALSELLEICYAIHEEEGG